MKVSHLILCMSVFFACSQKPDQTDSTATLDAPPKEVAFEMELAPQKPQTNQKLVKTGMIEFPTTDAAKTRSTILASVATHGGYVGNDEQQTMGDRVSYTLAVRIPAARFDTFLSDATKGVQQFDEKRIEVEDVTAQFTDDSLQLATKRKIETRYLQLLARANSVNDILNIEKALGEIRTDIERMEGAQKILSQQVSYSSLTIKFYDQGASQISFFTQVTDSVKDGWRYIKSFTISVISLWPFMLLAILITQGIKMWKRRNPKVA